MGMDSDPDHDIVYEDVSLGDSSDFGDDDAPPDEGGEQAVEDGELPAEDTPVDEAGDPEQARGDPEQPGEIPRDLEFGG